MTSDTGRYEDFGYKDAEAPCTSAYLLNELTAVCGTLQPGTRVLDVGSGNGFLAGYLLGRGCAVVGIDLSVAGIDIARRNYPGGRFEVLPADARILENLGDPPFDLVISTEVIEHVYSPRTLVEGCFMALKPGGRFVCSTPYHGYLKNLGICLLNRFDSHFDPLWQGGHIKFWTKKSLSRVLRESGFGNLRFRGAGRMPFLWKSMVVAADKPLEARDPVE